LGKREDRQGRTVHAGPTPVGAVGATDQHSQVQLFMEGPYDKAITFMTVDDLGVEVKIPEVAPASGSNPGLPADLAYLSGHTLGELLQAEYEATSAALAQMGRMNCTLRLPNLSAATIGETIMFFQLATGYAGAWYGYQPAKQAAPSGGDEI
jgi:glucose-6-phosphate isomerase